MGFFDAVGVLGVILILLYFAWKWYVYYQANKPPPGQQTDFTPLYVAP